MLETTLCYIEKDGRYLMLHRVKKENDLNHDKWIGIGGKTECGESPEECMQREVTEALLAEVKQTMEAYRDQKIPIMKKSVQTDEAIQMFREVGMTSKERLFHYRMTSRVNIYSLGNFFDYYYGYMVMDTSYIRAFDLVPYGSGFVLIGAIGLYRLPDFFTRLHGPTKASPTSKTCSSTFAASPA